MKKILCLCSLTFAVLSFAQVDKIYKHNGEVIEGNVKRVDEFTIEYLYQGEESVNTISKYAVSKIFYGKSTRIEEMSEKIEITDDDDWRKVVILEDKKLVAGLKKGDPLKAKTGWVNFRTGNGKDERTEKVLKMDAADARCPFILLLSDKMAGSSSKKQGTCYKYN